MLPHLTDVVVGGSRPPRNVTDRADGPRTGASKLLRSTGSTGVTRCRPTNTNAKPATSASRPSRSSPMRPLRRAPRAAASSVRSSPPWASSLRDRAFTRTTAEALPSPRHRRPARRHPPRRHPPTQHRRPLRLLRQPRRRRRHRRRRPTRYPKPRYFQSRRSDQRRCPAAIRGRSRYRQRQATCAGGSTPR
jgi:hypothetical protein